MKVKAEIEIEPFQTPNFVRTKSADESDHAVPLKALSAEDLEDLCEQFTNDVFEKAKKERPYRCVAG